MKHLQKVFGNIFSFSSIFIIPFITPLIGDGKRLKKIGIISLLVYFIYLVMGVVALLFLVPSIANINNTLSIYILARNISFGDFIQSIDALFILIWVMSIFSYLAIAMYYILNTFKKMTNIKNRKSMVYCFSAFLFILSLIPKNVSDVNYFESTFYKYASIALVFFVCFIILICGYLKKKHELKKGEVHLEKTS